MTQNSDETSITLQLNENSEGGRCAFCSEAVASTGFDFMEGWQPVCHSCAKERSPDLYRVFEDARAWMEATVTENYSRGVADGRRDCADAIVAVIKDDIPARVLRECLLQLEKAGEVLMDDNEMH